MKIRRATIQDYNRIMEMMIDFANSSPYSPQMEPDYNDLYVRKLLDHILKNGVIILGERDDKVVGMLIAAIQQDSWLPEVKTMKEIAWWVEQEHRMTSMGYKLLKKYVEAGEKMADAGLIDGFTLTLMDESPDLGLEKRGWKPIERNFLYEGAN